MSDVHAVFWDSSQGDGSCCGCGCGCGCFGCVVGEVAGDLDRRRSVELVSGISSDIVDYTVFSEGLLYIYEVIIKRIEPRMDTREHLLSKERRLACENKRLANSPEDIEVSCTLDREALERIRASPDGDVVLFSEMIDDYEIFEKTLKEQVDVAYSLMDVPDAERDEFSFALTDISVVNLHTPDENGSCFVAGSLAFPAVSQISFPGEVNNRKWRKIFDVNAKKTFLSGRQHAFLHPLKHGTIGSEYELINVHSKSINQVLYPNNKLVGQDKSPISYTMREDGSLEVNPTRTVLLHGHLINDTNAYEGDVRPVVHKYLAPSSDGEVKATRFVLINKASYQYNWFNKYREYFDARVTEKDGIMVPLEIYTQMLYDFQEQVNTNRVTSFARSGIWWNLQDLRPIRSMKFSLRMRLVPIVDKFGNSDGICYQNLLAHTIQNNGGEKQQHQNQ
jgi:hypothetical protein